LKEGIPRSVNAPKAITMIEKTRPNLHLGRVDDHQASMVVVHAILRYPNRT
jgi:hypothetical protein